MAENPESKLVTANRLLELLFDEVGRPSLRWLRKQQARKTIPYIKIGRRVFFDVPQVRLALQDHFTISQRDRVRKRSSLSQTTTSCAARPTNADDLTARTQPGAVGT